MNCNVCFENVYCLKCIDYKNCSSYQNILQLIDDLEKKSRSSIGSNLNTIDSVTIPDLLPQEKLQETIEVEKNIEVSPAIKTKKLERACGYSFNYKGYSQV
jgi:hypothetical protein